MQFGRRNLTPVQRIAVAKKYEDKLKEKAKENQGNRNDLLSKRTESADNSETRQEIARLANVGTGTLARYDVVMKSEDEDTKKQMLKNQISPDKAYKEVRPPIANVNNTHIKSEEKLKTKTCIKCGLKNGEKQCDNRTALSLDQIAEQLGIDQRSYANYKKLTTLIPEIQDLIQNDTISPSVASASRAYTTYAGRAFTKDLYIGKLV